jgi:hypothetical protein
MRLSMAALLLFLTACSGGSGNCTHLPGGGQYCLVEGPWPEFTAEQAATVTFQDKPQHLITRIQSGQDGLHFAGITPLGQTLIQVSWENGVLRSELPPALVDRLDPALFPALLQLATWPATQVRKGLSDHLELIETDGQRIVSDGQKNILIVSWEGKTLPYERLRFDAPAARLLIEARTLDEMAAP